MKPMTAILCGMILFLYTSPGCASSPGRGQENPAPAEEPLAGQTAVMAPVEEAKASGPAEQTDLQEEAGYEIISTPFGYVKKKKPQGGGVDAFSAPAKQRSVAAPAPVSAPAPSRSSVPLAEAPPVPAAQAPASEPAAEDKPLSLSATEDEEVPVIAVPEKTVDRSDPERPDQIRFDFDDADLASAIRVMADYLNISYIIDPGVTGKVTIHTVGHIKASDVFPIFYQTLEVNGLTAVREGNVYRIMKLKDASRMPIASRPAGSSAAIPPEERIILQIIPLKFISAEEISKVITPFVSPEGAIIAEGVSNTLLVVDKGINIYKILNLVEVFDVSVFEKTSYRFYTLENAGAAEVAETLGQVAPISSDSGKDTVKFIPIEWMNALLVVSASPEVFGRVEPLIRQLDIPSANAQPQIYVYSVKNGMAVDLGETLRAIFGVTGEQVKGAQREIVPTNPFAREYKDKNKETSKTETSERTESADRPETTVKPAAAATVTATSTRSGASSTLRGDVRITEDQIRNVLIVEAIPADYKVIARILERLDVLPRQVLIDVVIAEVTLGEGMELGIEWTFKNGDWTDNGSLAAKIGSSGLQYAVGFSSEWLAALNALANDSKLNIISSPSVLASDNRQAKIDVTTEVPIPSTEYTYVTDGDNVLETSVEYRDTGVILDVTPHINENGLVTMDISQEVSNVGSLIKVAGEDYYSFDTRKILTSLTVRHNQAIVIGGLISNQRKDAASGVPWLVKIPIIRWLTGTEENEEKRSELIVMITPHVITSLEDVDAVSEEFKHKIDDVKAVFK